MELVTGIEKGAIGFEVSCADDAGALETNIRATSLYRRGLPMHRTHTASVVDVSPHTWQLCSLEEYGKHFGINATCENHLAWCFTAGGIRYVVPALAAMRGFLSPASVTFTRVFRHAALEDFCDYDCNSGSMQIVSGISWLAGSSFNASMERLTWMYCYPSARRMWSSVSAHAMNERIGISLPQIRTTLVLKGCQTGDQFFVTSLRAQTIQPTEPAFEFAANRVSSAIKRRYRQIPLTAYERAWMGDVAGSLTDEEWAAVKHTLQSTLGRPPKNDPRELVDAILKKLNDSTAWDKTKYSSAVDVNQPRNAYGLWRRTGRWQAFSEAIAKVRAGQSPVP